MFMVTQHIFCIVSKLGWYFCLKMLNLFSQMLYIRCISNELNVNIFVITDIFVSHADQQLYNDF